MCNFCTMPESGVSLARLTQHQTKMSVAHVVNEFDPPDTKSVSTQEAMWLPEQRLAVSGKVTFGWVKQISTLRKANVVGPSSNYSSLRMVSKSL